MPRAVVFRDAPTCVSPAFRRYDDDPAADHPGLQIATAPSPAFRHHRANTLPVSQTIAQQTSGYVAARMELAVVLVPAVAFDKALPKQPES
jgi:hypothetical protein